MTAYTVARHRGVYAFGSSTLRAGGVMRCGSVHTGDGTPSDGTPSDRAASDRAASDGAASDGAASDGSSDGGTGGDFDLAVTDRHRIGVVARSGGRPVVTLHPDGARIPGPGGPVRWSLGRNSATLTRGDDRIDVRAGWPGSPLRVEVTGVWPEVELLVLTACFAVLSRRRQRLLTTVAVVGATSSVRT